MGGFIRRLWQFLGSHLHHSSAPLLKGGCSLVTSFKNWAVTTTFEMVSASKSRESFAPSLFAHTKAHTQKWMHILIFTHYRGQTSPTDRFVKSCQITPNLAKSRLQEKVRKTVRYCCNLTLFPFLTLTTFPFGSTLVTL